LRHFFLVIDTLPIEPLAPDYRL
jgi:hypothetical protein